MSDRKNQKVLWSDKEFIDILEKVKAKRILNGNPVKNLGQLTKEMKECKTFDSLIEELINKQKNDLNMIRFDKRLLY